MALNFDEGFEGSGYEEPTKSSYTAAWNEVGDGTINEDFATSSVPGGAPSNWGSQCLQMVAGSASTTTEAVLLSDETGAFYVRFDFVLHGYTASDYNWLAFVYDSSANFPMRVGYDHNGSNLRLMWSCNGEGVSYGTNLSEDTRYRIDFYYNPSGGWELRLDGGTEDSGGSTAYANCHSIKFSRYQGYTNEYLYVDNVQMATDGWIPADSTGGTWCWGHDTGVTEDNTGDLADGTGSGSVIGTGDAEALCLEDGENWLSPVVEIGDITFTVNYDDSGYGGSGSGGPGDIEYRTGVDQAGVSGEWNTYSGATDMNGHTWIQVRFSYTA